MTARWSKRIGCAIALSALLLGAGAVCAQTYEVFNESNATLNFETLDPERGTWKSWSIYPHQSREFNWRSGDRGKVRIATKDRGYVDYDVVEGNQYKFIWDSSKGMWDMRTVRRSANGAPGHGHPARPVANVERATWSLVNRTNETLQFHTREPNAGDWRAQSANPQEDKRFSFSPGVTQGRVRMATPGRGYVEYDVRAGWRYSIVFNARDGVWDFRTVERGS